MQRKLLIVVAVAAAALLFSCAQKDQASYGGKASWNNGKKMYRMELGAKLKVGVDNDKWGQQIVALWDKTHPEYAGAVSFVNFGSAGGADQITTLQGEAPDVALVIDGEVSRNDQSLFALDKVMVDVAKKVAQEPFFSNANGATPKFTPTAYDGMCFAWNKNMMEALGLATADANADGLPDAFDTWEEIFALAKEWQAKRPAYNGKSVNIVYPMSLDEVWSGYSSVTSAGWEIFKDGDPVNAGFDKPEFAKGLEFIKAASDAMVSVEANGKKTPGASMTWRWDDALNNQTAPFFLVGTWMDVVKAETAGGYDIKFGPLPTWGGQRLTPFVKTKGFVINGFTKFPSAAHELYRMLYTKDGMQTMVDNSSYIPSLVAKASITPDYSKDPNKAEMSGGFAYNYPEPSKVLPANKAKKAMDGYYNIGINLIYRGIWDGTKTPADASAEATSLFAKWVEANNK